MNDGDGAASRLTASVDRLRRTNVTLQGTPLQTAPDVETALSGCIRAVDRSTARGLARSWLLAAGRAADGDEPGRNALGLLARVVGVPADYFSDDGVAEAVDGRLAVAAGAARRGVRFHGPCRGVVPGADLGAIQDRLLRELRA